MALDLVLRNAKGSPLTTQEMDDNLLLLQSGYPAKATAATLTPFFRYTIPASGTFVVAASGIYELNVPVGGAAIIRQTISGTNYDVKVDAATDSFKFEVVSGTRWTTSTLLSQLVATTADAIVGLVVGSVAGASASATANAVVAANPYLNNTLKMGAKAIAAAGSVRLLGAGTVAVSSDAAGNITFTGAQTITGNAGSADKLSTARQINGVDFDGTANINVQVRAIYMGTNGEDLNTYQTEGDYFCQANAVAATLLNCPTTNAFALQIRKTAGVIQTLTEYRQDNNRKTYQRAYYNNVWSEWMRVVTSYDAAITSLVTSTSAAGLTNVVTTNTNTFLNSVDISPGRAANTTSGSSVQITGAGTVTVASDAAGKLTITGAQTITGNAATATKLATARAISVTGGATGTANFDGSADAAINVTALDATKLTGFVPIGSQTGVFDINGSGPSAQINGLYVSELVTQGTTLNPITTAAIVGQINTNRSVAFSVDTLGYMWGFRSHTTAGTYTFQSKVQYSDRLTTPRTIALSGAATGSATAFDGSAAITIPVTALDMASATAGTLAVARGGTGTTTSTGSGSNVLSASPTFTGTPLSTTAADGTSTTQVATTAFVQNTVGGALSKAVTGGTVTLTAAEASNAMITLTGALTSNLTLTFPAGVRRLWTIMNSTTGAFTVTCKLSTGTGETVTQGKKNIITSDGTNFYAALDDYHDIAITGNPTVTTQAKTDNSTRSASTAHVKSVVAEYRTTAGDVNITGTTADNDITLQGFFSGATRRHGITMSLDGNDLRYNWYQSNGTWYGVPFTVKKNGVEASVYLAASRSGGEGQIYLGASNTYLFGHDTSVGFYNANGQKAAAMRVSDGRWYANGGTDTYMYNQIASESAVRQVGNLGGAFGKWTAGAVPVIQVDCPDYASAYMLWRATRWGSSHLAAMHVYEGPSGGSGSMVSMSLGGVTNAYTWTRGGDFSANTDIYARGVKLTSDERLKDVTGDITDALSINRAMAKVMFSMKNSDSVSAGYLAQSVEKVAPWAVTERDSREWERPYVGDKAKVVDYNAVSVVHGAAIQELEDLISRLTQRVETLEG